MEKELKRSFLSFFFWVAVMTICFSKAETLSFSLFLGSMVLFIVGVILSCVRYWFRYKNKIEGKQKDRKYWIIAILIFVFYILIRTEIKHLIVNDFPAAYYSILIAFLIVGVLVGKYGVKTYLLNNQYTKNKNI